MGRNKKKSPRSARASSKAPIWVFMGVFAFALVLYLNTLGHGFVFDDQTLILQNPQVTQLDWGGILGLRTGYRQVRTFTYAVNYLIGGTDPVGFHLFNVLLHAVNTLLVFQVIRLLLGRAEWLSAALGSLLFAAFPAQTAAVAYISGRKDLLACFFILAAFLVYLSIRERLSQPDTATYRGLVAVAVLFTLAFFSKEVALVFPVLLVWTEACLRSAGIPRWLPRSKLWLAATVTATVLSGAGLAYSVYLTQATRRQELWGDGLVEHVGTSFKLFAHYLRLAVVPHPLIADYTGDVFPLSRGLTDPATVLAMLVAFAYIALTVWTFWKAPAFSFGLGWFLIFLLPVLQIIPFHELAADHFLYLPYVGIALVWALGVRSLFRRSMKPLGYGLVAIVLGIFSFQTVSRNPVWKSEGSLWTTTIAAAPNSYRANLNLGSLYHQESRRQTGETRERLRAKALESTKRAAEMKPDEPLPWGNLGAFYREIGYSSYEEGKLAVSETLEREAMRALSKSLDLDAGDPFMHSNLGDAHKDMALIWDARNQPQLAFEERAKAIKAYQDGLAIGSHNPAIAVLWFKIGMVFADAGMFSDVNFYLREAVDEPVLANYAPVHYWSGYAYYLEGNWERAVHYLARAAQLAGTFEAYWYLARSYEQLGTDQGKIIDRQQVEAAVRGYVDAIQKKPDSLEANFNVGVLYFRLGNYGQSRRFLNQALALAPDSVAAGTTDTITRNRVRQMLAQLPS